LAFEITDRSLDAALKIIARRKQEAVYRPVSVEAVEIINFADKLGDLPNSDYAGHRPLDFVRRAAGLSDRVASGS
jgi:hypothetical protein